MRRVLCTGGTGFVGKPVLERLAGRFGEVHASTSRPLRDRDDGPVRWHRANLLDDGDVDRLIDDVRPTHLLHLAWFAEPGAFWRAPENLDWLASGARLIRRFADAGGERAVFAGTCAEYDWRFGWCSEGTTPCAPRTLYGASKNALRSVVEAHRATARYSAAWARLFFMYGPAEPEAKVVAATIRALLQSREARCSPGSQMRDFLHVHDVADALVAILDSPIEGAINIASGKPVSVAEVVGEAARQIGRPDLLRLGALPTSADEPPLIAADIRRLVHEVGFVPRHSLQSGLEQAIAWWRQRGAESPC